MELIACGCFDVAAEPAGSDMGLSSALHVSEVGRALSPARMVVKPQRQALTPANSVQIAFKQWATCYYTLTNWVYRGVQCYCWQQSGRNESFNLERFGTVI
jgi:hypothetical protein